MKARLTVLMGAFLLAVSGGVAQAAVETGKRDFNGEPVLMGASFDSATGNLMGDTTGQGDEPRMLASSEDGVLHVDPVVWDSSYTLGAITTPQRIDAVAVGTAPIHVAGVFINRCSRASADQVFGIYDTNAGSTSPTNVKLEIITSTVSSQGNADACTGGPRWIEAPLRLTTGLTIMNTQGGITGALPAQVTIFWRHTRNTKAARGSN